MRVADPKSQAVGAFYDQHHEAFRRAYGTLIQAFRTRDPRGILDHEAATMGLSAGQRLLDAGCGVGAPAIHFATHYGVQVEALTVSSRQAEAARQAVREAGCADRVSVTEGDYHRLEDLFPPGHFDAICFLESFGHSHDKAGLLAGCLKALRPGGTLYIKDLFVKEAVLESHRAPIQKEIDRINAAYHYEIADLYQVLGWVRKAGYILSRLSTIDIPVEEFENLTISNDFQELTGIARIENWAQYVFPVDFFEVKCLKPWHGPAIGGSRYFLQNLYHLRVMGDRIEDL